MISGMNTLVEVISADINRLTEDLLEDHSARLFSRGGHFNKSQLIPVYFLLISGCYEEDTYNNFLYSLRDDIKRPTDPLHLSTLLLKSRERLPNICFRALIQAAAAQ